MLPFIMDLAQTYYGDHNLFMKQYGLQREQHSKTTPSKNNSCCIPSLSCQVQPKVKLTWDYQPQTKLRDHMFKSSSRKRRKNIDIAWPSDKTIHIMIFTQRKCVINPPIPKQFMVFTGLGMSTCRLSSWGRLLLAAALPYQDRIANDKQKDDKTTTFVEHT
jgi:hypothetical protein